MENETLNNRLKQFIVPANNDWMEQAALREDNRDWLTLSGRIAARVLTVLKSRKMTQVQLAEAMGVSPQYVNKVLKGNENLQIDTISKMGQCLGVSLLEVPAATGLEYEAKGAETEATFVSVEFFEKLMFNSTLIAERRERYSRSTSRSATRVRVRPYPIASAECKVTTLTTEQTLYSEAI